MGDKRVMPLYQRIEQEKSWNAHLKRWQTDYDQSLGNLKNYIPFLKNLNDNGIHAHYTLDSVLYLLDHCFSDFKDKANHRIVPPRFMDVKNSQKIGINNLFTVPVVELRTEKIIGYEFHRKDFSVDELETLTKKLEETYRVLSWPIQSHARYAVTSDITEKLDLIVEVGLKASDNFKKAHLSEGNITSHEVTRSRGLVIGYFDEEYILEGKFKGEKTYQVLSFEDNMANRVKDALLGFGLLIHDDFGDLNAYRPTNIEHDKIKIGKTVTYMNNHVRDFMQFPQDMHDITILDLK